MRRRLLLELMLGIKISIIGKKRRVSRLRLSFFRVQKCSISTRWSHIIKTQPGVLPVRIFDVQEYLCRCCFLVDFNQLIELYQFRNMPPGLRLSSLPLIGNFMSFD